MPAQNSPGITQNNGGAELKFSSQYHFTKEFSLKFQPWMQDDGWTKEPEEKNQFELQELTLEWKRKSRKIKFGYSTLHWEGTDFVNPMDLMSVKNWRDPLNSQDRGMPGAYYSDQIGNFSWDLAYVPVQVKAELPGANSPWLPRRIQLPTENDDLILRLPNQVQYHFDSDEVINHAFLNNGALRLQYHGDGWDASLAGMQGASSTPMIMPIVDATPVEIYPKQIYQLNSPVRLETLYYLQRSAAFAFVETAGSWIFRLSGQHTQSVGDDTRLPGWSEYGVLGIEKNFDFNDQPVTLIFQATTSRRPQTDDISVISTLLERSYMLGWRLPFTEKWTWTSAFFQEQKYKSYYIHTEFNYTPMDHWKLGLSGDAFSGSKDSVIGIYDHNDRAMLVSTFSF